MFTNIILQVLGNPGLPQRGRSERRRRRRTSIGERKTCVIQHTAIIQKEKAHTAEFQGHASLGSQ
jgi:hypothetical protein